MKKLFTLQKAVKNFFSRLSIIIFGRNEYVTKKELKRSAPYTYGPLKRDDNVNMLLREKKPLLVDRFSGKILYSWLKNGFDIEPQEVRDLEAWLERIDELAEWKVGKKNQPKVENIFEKSPLKADLFHAN